MPFLIPTSLDNKEHILTTQVGFFHFHLNLPHEKMK
jgi:hypothetical protein